MLTYSDATNEFAKRRGGSDRKKLANNTYLYKLENGAFGVRLHDTIVVTILDNGTYRLNTGGWSTVTTKERINRFSPARVFSDKGIWYIENMDTIFEDGCTVNASGQRIDKKPDSGDIRKCKSKLDKMVREYIKGFANHVLENGLQNPGSGDCWGCYMSDVKPGKLDNPMGLDHFLTHFEEKYYVPSLLWNAVKLRGYSNPGFIWQMMQQNAQGKYANTRILEVELWYFFRKLKPELLKLID